MHTEKKFLKNPLRWLVEREKAPETHLVKTVAFWLLTLPPLSFGIWLTYQAGLFLPEYLNASTDSYTEILHDFKLPFGIMSLAIPLAALSAAIHRSVQTSRQIKEQYSQNIFSNHLAHREYFFKFIADSNPFAGLSSNNAKLYEILFPNAVNGDLAPDEEFLTSVLEDVYFLQSSINKSLSEALKNNRTYLNGEKIINALENYDFTAENIIENHNLLPEEIKLEDLFATTQSKLQESSKLLEGLIHCANFHRFYIEKQELTYYEKTDALYVDNILLASELRPRQMLFRELRISIDDYFDKDLNYRDYQDDTLERFHSRINSVLSNLKINPESELVAQVIEECFAINEQELIKMHLDTKLEG